MKLSNFYKILNKQDQYEVRQYTNLLTAKVTVTGPYEAAYRNGSKILSSYFNGNNYKKCRIGAIYFFILNSHVNGWDVSCILPEKFSILSHPRPTGDLIKIEESKARNAIVHCFSGKSAYSEVMMKFEKLKKWAENSNQTLSKSERIIIYHSKIPYFRKNEIQVDRL